MADRRIIAVEVLRAGSVQDEDIIPDLNIYTVGYPPISGCADATAVYEAQARAIVDAMWECLPGGLVDRLVAEMLKRHASILSVRYEIGPRAPTLTPGGRR